MDLLVPEAFASPAGRRAARLPVTVDRPRARSAGSRARPSTTSSGPSGRSTARPPQHPRFGSRGRVPSSSRRRSSSPSAQQSRVRPASPTRTPSTPTDCCSCRPECRRRHPADARRLAYMPHRRSRYRARRRLFASADAIGSQMAGRSVEGVGDPRPSASPPPRWPRSFSGPSRPDHRHPRAGAGWCWEGETEGRTD